MARLEHTHKIHTRTLSVSCLCLVSEKCNHSKHSEGREKDYPTRKAKEKRERKAKETVEENGMMHTNTMWPDHGSRGARSPQMAWLAVLAVQCCALSRTFLCRKRLGILLPLFLTDAKPAKNMEVRIAVFALDKAPPPLPALGAYRNVREFSDPGEGGDDGVA